MFNKDYLIKNYTEERRQTYLPPDIDLKSLKAKFKDVYQYPRVKGDLLFVPFADGRIECHDLSNNKIVWTNATFGKDRKPNYIVSDMTLYVDNEELLVMLNGVVYMLAISDGFCNSSIEIRNQSLDGVVIHNGSIYCYDKKGDNYFIEALSIEAAGRYWCSTIPLKNGAKSIAMTGDQLLVMDGLSHNIISYNTHNGSEDWRLSAQSFAVDDANKFEFCADPVVRENLLVTSISDGHVICIDITSGQLAWKVKMIYRYVGPISCTPDGIIYAMSNLVIYCIDIFTGEVISELGKGKLKTVYPTSLFVAPSVITENQLLLYSTRYKSLAAINRQTGDIEQSIDIKKLAFPVPFIAADRLFLLDQKNNLYISKPAK